MKNDKARHWGRWGSKIVILWVTYFLNSPLYKMAKNFGPNLLLIM